MKRGFDAGAIAASGVGVLLVMYGAGTPVRGDGHWTVVVAFDTGTHRGFDDGVVICVAWA